MHSMFMMRVSMFCPTFDASGNGKQAQRAKGLPFDGRGLGDQFMSATAKAWRKVPPGSEHEQGKHAVSGNEDPRRRVVIEQLLEPVLDEAAAIRRVAGARTQPHFQGGQRTREAEPGLGDDDSYSRHMSDAKPSVVHPIPALEIACDDDQQPYNDKRHDADVNHQHSVGEQQAKRRVEQHKSP